MRLLLFALLLTAPLAHAQRDDEAIPYSDDERDDDRNRRELPSKSDASTDRERDETEDESLQREESLAGVDDPSKGLSGELIFGVLLLDSSRGAVFEPKALGGVRFTWEWPRAFLADELVRELSFVDVSFFHAGSSEGTTQIYAKSYFNYFSVAPAFSFPLGAKSPVAVYAQLGIGFVFNPSVVVLNGTPTAVAGNKLLIQYGGGLRFRPLILTWARDGGTRPGDAEAIDGLRLSFRIELTRFRRGYIDDTFVGGGLGVTF